MSGSGFNISVRSAGAPPACCLSLARRAFELAEEVSFAPFSRPDPGPIQMTNTESRSPAPMNSRQFDLDSSGDWTERTPGYRRERMGGGGGPAEVAREGGESTGVNQD